MVTITLPNMESVDLMLCFANQYGHQCDRKKDAAHWDDVSFPPAF